MNDENIAQLIVELDKLSQYVPAGNTLTSEWLEQEYLGVTIMRDQGKPSYINEYRIKKIFIEARTNVVLKQSDKLALFITACRIIKSIEDALKEIYNERQRAKDVNAEVEKILALPL
ncbi:hypothetical protein ACJMK2_019313 [Sinanodonta woodiana]|uniref:Uncharacterized protein n=1 Tax=Sinanodonta woodiana TaxID=1069815 RepID=A0ABD3UHH1_SINWO